MATTSERWKMPVWVVAGTLSFIPLLMVLGNSVLIPVLPTMERSLHVSKFQVSLFITLFSVPAGVIIPIAGYLSDRISRKWIVGPSLIVFGIGGVMAGIVSIWMKNPYSLMLVARIIQGIGAAGTAPIAMAWIGDLFSGSERSRVLGINEAGNAMGKVVSPIIGSVVALLGWFAVFFVFPILCIPIACFVWWFLPDDENRRDKPEPFTTYIGSLMATVRREGRWLFTSYLAGAAALFTLFGVLFYLSDVLESKYSMNGVLKGFVLAIPLLFLSVASLFTGLLIRNRRVLMKWLVVVGFVIVAASLVLCSLLTNGKWTLVAMMSLTGLGTGMVLPCLNTFITSAVSKEKRGMVTSLYGSVRFLGVAAGPPIFTWLLSKSTTVMLMAVASLSVCLAGLSAWLIRPSGKDERYQDDKPTVKDRVQVTRRNPSRF